MGILDLFGGDKLLASIDKNTTESKPQPKRWDAMSAILGFLRTMRKDQFTNPLMGFGNEADKHMYTHMVPDRVAFYDELSNLFYYDDICHTMVARPAQDAMRRGYEIITPNIDEEDGEDQTDPEKDLSRELREYGEDLKIDQLMVDASTFGRLFGGSVIVIGADDGQDLSEPLNEDAIRTIDALTHIDLRYISAIKYYEDPLQPNFGIPSVYHISSASGPVLAAVHETRLLRFENGPVDLRMRRALRGWTFSVLQAPLKIITSFATAFRSVDFMISDGALTVYKLGGYVNQLSQAQDDVQTRMQLMDMNRSVGRSIILDKSLDEEFERLPIQYNGIPELLSLYMQRVAAAAGMPVALLFGKFQAGLNASGDAEFRNYYDTICHYQETVLKPNLSRLYYLIAKAGDGPSMADPDMIDIKFRPPWAPTDKEQAELELLTAQKDHIYLQDQVAEPEEIALSRYGGQQFSAQTQIDIGRRKEALASIANISTRDYEENATNNEGTQPSPGTATGATENAGSRNQVPSPDESNRASSAQTGGKGY